MVAVSAKTCARCNSFAMHLGTPPPGHLLITGGNATGKSTFVSALAWKFRHDRSCLARTITVKCRDLVGKKTDVVRQELKKQLMMACGWHQH